MKTQKLMNLIAVLSVTLLFGATVFGQVVINEVYSGGGNAGAPFDSDFVELINPTAAPVNLAGYTIAYATATGTFATSAQVALTGTIPAGGRYLIQFGGGASGGAALPAPQATGTTNFATTGGNVILVNSAFVGVGTNFACPLAGATGVVDRVGYGTGTCFETAAAPAGSNTLSINRTAAVDTNNNSIDFTTAAPTPMNAAPTAGEVFVGGRVMDNRGFPIGNATVILSGGPLTQSRTVRTSGFGYFGFRNVSVGNTYLVSVMSGRYSFDQPALIINLSDEENNLLFTGTRFFGSASKGK